VAISITIAASMLVIRERRMQGIGFNMEKNKEKISGD
jgi:hypothetical protein